MPESSIFDHDNSAINAQVKRPLQHVMEHYNIPRPIKLKHSNNLKIVQKLDPKLGLIKKICWSI